MPDFSDYERMYGGGGAGPATPARSQFDEFEDKFNPGVDFEMKLELLRRASGSNVSPRGIALDYDGGGKGFQGAVNDEYASILKASGYDAGMRRADLEALIAKLPEPDRASASDKATILAGRLASGMNAPTMGIVRKFFGEGGPLESKDAMRAAEGIADPARDTLGPDRYARAVQALRSTRAGRVGMAGAELLGATPGLISGGRVIGKVTGPKLGTPATLAHHGALSNLDDDPLAAAGEGALFGGLAHGISAPLQKWLAKLPAATRTRAMQELSGRGTSAVSFAGADAILHGPDGERALSNALFGAALGGRLRADPGKALGPNRKGWRWSDGSWRPTPEPGEGPIRADVVDVRPVRERLPGNGGESAPALPRGSAASPQLPRGAIRGAQPDMMAGANRKAVEFLEMSHRQPQAPGLRRMAQDAILRDMKVGELRAEAKRLGVPHGGKARKVAERVIERYELLLRVGRAKGRAVEQGARDVESGEIVPVRPQEVASEGRVEAARQGADLAAAEPRMADGGRNIEAGFKPIAEAREAGIIVPEAEPVIRKVEEAGAEPFNSHVDPETGEVSALGVKPDGEVVRASIKPEVYPGTRSGTSYVIGPDASKPGRWRVTRLDENMEPIGHTEADSLHTARSEARMQGADVPESVLPRSATRVREYLKKAKPVEASGPKAKTENQRREEMGLAPRQRSGDPERDSLSTFVRLQGGIAAGKDGSFRGELARIKHAPFLVRKLGGPRSADRVTQEAIEHGYLEEGSTPADLVELLERDLAGEKVYSTQRPVDEAMAAELESFFDAQARRFEAGERGHAAIGDAVEAVERGVKGAARAVGNEIGSGYGRLRRSAPKSGATAEFALRQVEKVTTQETAAVRKRYEAAREIVAAKGAKEGFQSLARLDPASAVGGEIRSRLDDVYEGRANPTAAEREIIEAAREYIHLGRGKQAEKVVQGFKSRPDRLPRIYAPDYGRALRQGPMIRGKANPAWEAYEAMYAKRLGSQAAARKYMEAEAERYESGGPAGLDVRSQFEFKREIEDLPGAVVGKDGKVYELLETNPARRLESLHERGAKRLAFLRVFGSPEAATGEPRKLTQLRKQLKAEGGDVEFFDMAVRAVQGSPMELPKNVDFEARGLAAKASAVSNVLAASVLGKAVKAVATEPVGPYFEVVGAARGTKAMVEATIEAMVEFTSGVTSPRMERLRDMGMPSPYRPVRTRDPNRGFEDAMRRWAEVESRVNLFGPATRVLNENAYWYGVDAWMEGLRAGRGGAGDAQSLRIYGEYTPEQARRLAEGQARPDEYAEATKRIVDNLSGVSHSPVSQSRLENRRWFKTMYKFTRYVSTQIRTEARWLRDVARAAKSGSTRGFGGTVARYARHVLGRTAQGAFYQLMVHLLSGGDLEQYKRRWQTNPWGEFWSATLSSMAAGSFGAVGYEIWNDRVSGADTPAAVAGSMAEMSWPVAVIGDMYSAANGEGRYEGMGKMEAAKAFAMRWRNQNSDLMAYADILGINGEQGTSRQNLRVARREYYRYIHGPGPRGFSLRERRGDEQDKQFRAAMARVQRAIRDFAPVEEIREELMAAAGVKDPKAARESLLRRRILGKAGDPLSKVPEDKRGKIEGALTEETIRTIQEYDRSIERLADWIHRPASSAASGRRRRRRGRR